MTGKAVTAALLLITGVAIGRVVPVGRLLSGCFAVALSAPADDVRYTGQADLAPFAYAYRKGGTTNPIETRWLNPQADVLCGLLWEERRSVQRIEVEFPLGTWPAPAIAAIAQQVRLVTRAAAAPFEEASVPGMGLGPPKEFTLQPTADPVVTPQGTTLLTFASQDDIVLPLPTARKPPPPTYLFACSHNPQIFPCGSMMAATAPTPGTGVLGKATCAPSSAALSSAASMLATST